MNQHKKRGSESCDSKPLWRLLHEGDLLRCFRNSVSVTYVSTLPSTLSSAPCISYFVQSLCTYEANVREWHFGDCCIIPHLRRHFRDSGLVMCVSTLPSPHSQFLASGAFCKVPAEKAVLFRRKIILQRSFRATFSFVLSGSCLCGVVEDWGAGGKGGADGDDPLIGAATEAKPEVPELSDEASVHEDITEF